MKITKRQLRRIIQEEKQKLDETSPIRKSPAQRVEHMARLIEDIGPKNFARAFRRAMGDDQDRLESLMRFIEMHAGHYR